MREPRVLIFDIETSPHIAAVFGTYQTNTLWIEQYSHLMSYAFKWLGSDDPVVGCSQPDHSRSYKRNRTDDRQLVESCWKLLDEADAVVAHYGDRFDVPKMNGFFLNHGMDEPSRFSQIDTKKIASNRFGLANNKLETICDYLGIGHKLPNTGVDLWRRCMAGDPEAWDTMNEYCMHDVELLEAVYLRLRPWARGNQHPNMALISGDLQSCPKCGAPERHLQKRGQKYRRTQQSHFQQWQCMVCRGYSSSKLSKETAHDRPKRTTM